MASVDNRVVQMEFDNASFERRLAETTASLDRLKAQLDFTKVSGDLGKSLNQSFNGFNPSVVTAGIEGISNKFLALKTVAFTVVSEITRAFTGLSQRLATELFRPDTIIQGFSEYELKMGSIQTILASSGADLATVNRKLEELNTYSDRTIYSFADMTQNIGKFTNAGVDLDRSVAAIQGVANVAAVSGANAGEAARSMYNFSQALSSGSVRLEDWRSIELANMGTVEFKQQLIDAAVAVGTLTKQGDGWVTSSGTFVSATKGFNASLTEQWLTSQVLVDTLNAYADETTDIGKKAFAAAQDIKTFSQLMSTLKETLGSGWAQSFEIIIGNLDEAKALFGSVSASIGGFINRSSDARNELLRGWKDAGGRALLIQTLADAFGSLGDILGAIGKAFRNVFPPATVDTLMDLTRGFAALVARMKPTESALIGIEKLFTGLFSVVKLLVTVGVGVVRFFGSLFGILSGGNNGLFATIGAFGDLLTFLTTDVFSSDRIARVFEGLASAFDKAYSALRPFISILGLFVGYLVDLGGTVGSQFASVFERAFGGVSSVFSNVLEAIGAFGTELEQAVRGLFSGGGSGGAGGGGVFGGIGEAITSSWEALLDSIESLDFSGFDGITGRIKDRLASISGPLASVFGEFGGGLESVADLISKAGQFLADAVGTFVSKLSDVLGSGDFDQLYDLINVGLIGGVLYFLKRFADEGLKLDFSGGLFDSVKEVLGGLTDTLKTMQLSIKADALMRIAGAVGILAASMLVLAMIDSAALTRALGAMTVGFANLVGTLVILDKSTSLSGTGGLVGTSFAMNLMATSLLLLAGSVALFGTMDIDTLAKGIGSITVLFLGIAGFAKLIEANSEALAKAGGSLVPFGFGLILLTKAVEKFSQFSPGELALGMVGLGTSLLIIAKSIAMMPPNVAAIGAGLLLVGAALEVISWAVNSFASMSLYDMTKGLVGVALALQAIGVGLSLMPTSNMVQIGAGLVLVGIGLNFIARAVRKMGELSMGELIKGIVGLTVVLVPLAFALELMKGTIAGSGALLIAAFALSIFAGVVSAFAAIGLGDLVKGLFGIVAVLGVLGLTSVALSAAVPAMLALGVALLALGAGFAALGASVYLAASGMVLFASLGPEAFGNVLKAVKTFVQVLPALLAGIAEGLLEFAQVFLEGIPMIVGVIGKIINAILDEFIKIIPKILTIAGLWIQGIIGIFQAAIPKLVAAGYAFLVALLEGLSKNIGRITNAVSEIIVEFLTALSDNMPQLTKAGAELIASFLGGITNNLGIIIPAVVALIAGIINAIAGQIPVIVKAAVNLLTSFLTGITNALYLIGPYARRLIERLGLEIAANVRVLTSAAVGVVIAFADSIADNAFRLISKGVDIIIQFIKGVAANGIRLANAAADTIITFVRALAATIDTKAPEMRSAGWDLAVAIINGMTAGLAGKAGDVVKSITGIAGKMVSGVKGFFGIKSPSRVMMGIGANVVEGLAKGLDDNVVMAITSARNFSKTVADAMELGIAENQPTITRVLDLSSVQSGFRQLDGMVPSMTSYEAAAGIASLTGQRYVPEDVNVTGTGEVVFNQTINAPRQLSVAEIYRQTRSQLAIAKQELAIR